MNDMEIKKEEENELLQIKRILGDIYRMKELHEKESFLCIDPDVNPRHSVYYPPDYAWRKPEKRDDLYCYFVKCYEEISGAGAFPGFQMHPRKIRKFPDSMMAWDPEIRINLVRLYVRCTSASRKRRPEGVEAVIASEEFQSFLRFVRMKEGKDFS